jgi:hypothetical protein
LRKGKIERQMIIVEKMKEMGGDFKIGDKFLLSSL